MSCICLEAESDELCFCPTIPIFRAVFVSAVCFVYLGSYEHTYSTVQAVADRWITWYKLQHNTYTVTMCQVSHIPANTVDGTFNFMCYTSALSERTLTI